MFCCLGLIAGLIVGGHIGLGIIVTPIGFIGGIAVDIAILRQFFGKGKGKDESKSTASMQKHLSLPDSPHFGQDYLLLGHDSKDMALRFLNRICVILIQQKY